MVILNCAALHWEVLRVYCHPTTQKRFNLKLNIRYIGMIKSTSSSLVFPKKVATERTSQVPSNVSDASPIPQTQ